MVNYQKYFTNMVDAKAQNLGLTMTEQRDYTNKGVWIFKRQAETIRKIYFDFQSNYAHVRLGNGNIFKGVRFEYGDPNQETCAMNFIFSESNIERK